MSAGRAIVGLLLLLATGCLDARPPARPAAEELVAGGPTLAPVPAPSVASTPAPEEPVITPSETAAPAAPSATPRYSFPVQPANAASYIPDHHTYPATDIFAACGADVVAVTDGILLELRRVDSWRADVDDPATRGGMSFTLVGNDEARYYGSHLAGVDDAIVEGARVVAGQRIGAVGESGNAVGKGCHLHFGISPPCGVGDWDVRRGVIWPAPYLDRWRGGDGAASPAAEVAAWRAANGDRCPGA